MSSMFGKRSVDGGKCGIDVRTHDAGGEDLWLERQWEEIRFDKPKSKEK